MFIEKNNSRPSTQLEDIRDLLKGKCLIPLNRMWLEKYSVRSHFHQGELSRLNRPNSRTSFRDLISVRGRRVRNVEPAEFLCFRFVTNTKSIFEQELIRVYEFEKTSGTTREYVGIPTGPNRKLVHTVTKYTSDFENELDQTTTRHVLVAKDNMTWRFVRFCQSSTMNGCPETYERINSSTSLLSHFTINTKTKEGSLMHFSFDSAAACIIHQHKYRAPARDQSVAAAAKMRALCFVFVALLAQSAAWNCYPAPSSRICDPGYEVIPMRGSATCCGSPVNPPAQSPCIPCNNGCPDGYRQVTDYKYCACCSQ
ncbi:hypothetical protein QR680_006618 [Steinernema hermaphroditum]|uniref:Uncharacterized protein n=1 Tax=Steinernema hermaphroditum TaxID=289476 RepID=A0AA39LXE6_9BILA|nr:hypothetical protein QR680_006618 [Steinernema hermaphroditum]